MARGLAFGSSRLLGRIWVRFGLWIAATVLLTIALLACSILVFGQLQQPSDEHTLAAPPSDRRQADELTAGGHPDNDARAPAVSRDDRASELLLGGKLSLLVGLAVCLPFGLIAGFWVSRTITLPLGSMAAAAQRIAQGDLSVRAEPGQERGEMAEMVSHFNHMANALERFERERKATTAVISHELRTPLTILQARLHAACDGVIAPTAREFGHLLDQAEHLGRLVDDLHTLSMAEAGRLPLRLEPLDLVELARNALQRHAMRLARQDMTASLDARVPTALVMGDKDRLRQVLSNLIENAFRHAHAGGWLELGISRQDGPHPPLGAALAVLTVSDAGPGLPDEAQRNMFRGLSDPQGRSKRADGGSGLGLSIVHLLARQHGGDVSVDRSARGGTRFTVRLPLIADGGMAAPAATPPC